MTKLRLNPWWTSLFNQFILIIIALVAQGIGALHAEQPQTNSTAADSAAADRPNIVFILTDDQSHHSLGAYGNTVCQTPNIDRIAKQGLRLNDAHHMGAWSGAVCFPSRTMIMTGKSLWHLPNFSGPQGKGIGKAEKRAREVAAAQSSMPALFNAAGYDTFRTCKRGNTFGPANKLFAVVHDADKREATDEGGSKWHGDRAIEFLEQRHASGDADPFLMFVGFSHPHDPRNGKEDLLKKYGARNSKEPLKTVNEKAPALPVNYLPAHPFPHGHPNLRDETQVQGVLTDRSEATIRNEKGREYACIENIDIEVGRVLDKLEAMGELKNTYVFFTSDHGIAVGRHGLVGKQNLYEHTWRVPFLASGPGIKAGGQASGYIYLLDVLPTMCDLAEIEIPQGIDGLSFRAVLEGRQDRMRDVLYGAYCGGTKPGMRCVKTDQWKLIKYDVLDGEVHETQLFNLKENPSELLQEHHAPEVISLTGNKPSPEQVDLAEDARYTKKRSELEALLLEQQRQLDDPYRLWDQPK